MKDAEDEAFEQLALKQGQWEHTSGWRKRQIMDTQAFPNPHRTDMTGMTLRDYFAAKAMKEIMAQAYELEKEFHVDNDFSFPDTMCSITKEAYKWADAMLKAREA